jgi:hypothetical protein
MTNFPVRDAGNDRVSWKTICIALLVAGVLLASGTYYFSVSISSPKSNPNSPTGCLSWRPYLGFARREATETLQTFGDNDGPDSYLLSGTNANGRVDITFVYDKQ